MSNMPAQQKVTKATLQQHKTTPHCKPMNYTNSGALAVGAPHSLARYNEECNHAIQGSDVTLLLTEEGNEILRCFAKSIGCDYDGIAEYNQNHPGHTAEWLNKNSIHLHCFMRGVMMRWKTIQ